MTTAKAEAKQERAKLNAARRVMAERAERAGQAFLDLRRRQGIPDPDGREWGRRMLDFQLGLASLAIAAEQPGFTIAAVPDGVRHHLRSPLTGEPATDDALAVCLDVLRQEGVA